MLIDLSHAVGAYLHDVFIAKSRLVGSARLCGAGSVRDALRGAVDRLRARRQKRHPDRILVLLDRRRRDAARLCALPQDPVFILGQAFGVFVYLRNLYFELRDRGSGAAPASERAVYRAAASAAKPRSRSPIRSSTSSSPMWKRTVGPPGAHVVAVRMRVQSNGMARLS